MMLVIEIALGIAFGVALVPVVAKVVAICGDAAARASPFVHRQWKRLLVYGILAAVVAWFAIAIVAELRREEAGRRYLEMERMLRP